MPNLRSTPAGQNNLASLSPTLSTIKNSKKAMKSASQTRCWHSPQDSCHEGASDEEAQPSLEEVQGFPTFERLEIEVVDGSVQEELQKGDW